MPSEVDWSIEGDVRFSEALRGLYEMQTDFTRVWPLVAAKFWESERRQFDSQGGRADSWPKLSASYAASKEVSHPGQPILRVSGDLFRSLTRGPIDKNAVYEARPDSLTLGTNDPKARFHQTGTSRMPARPPIDLVQRDYEEMRDVARESFANQALELGFEVIT